jgi:hypothetical protein
MERLKVRALSSNLRTKKKKIHCINHYSDGYVQKGSHSPNFVFLDCTRGLTVKR